MDRSIRDFLRVRDLIDVLPFKSLTLKKSLMDRYDFSHTCPHHYTTSSLLRLTTGVEKIDEPTSTARRVAGNVK